ncbi:MAG: cupin domain-containing protein [Pyrinomonadaceae bacterium]
MHIARSDVPERLNVPGAIARQALDFGDATGYGKFAAEYFSLAAGTDIAPLLRGLEGDLCQSPHWGYLIDGQVTVTYAGGEEEDVNAGDLFYWPPGHSVRVGKDAEVILFSPQTEHCEVVDHLRRQLVGE